MQLLTQGFRINWWQVIEDLRRTGLSVEKIVESTEIPKSTLLGYRNLDAEPKHADGEQLKQLWLRRMVPPLPVMAGNTRISGWLQRGKRYNALRRDLESLGYQPLNCLQSFA